MPAKPCTTGHTARSNLADIDNADFGSPSKRPDTIAKVGDKRSRAPPSRLKVKAMAKRDMEGEGEGNGLQDVNRGSEEESEEEEEKLEYRPAKQARRTSILNHSVLKKVMIQYQAEEQQRTQAKKRSKKPSKDKIDAIFEQGSERLEAAWNDTGGYTECKASIKDRIAATLDKLDVFKEENEALDQAMKGHQMAFNSFSAQLESYVQDRQAVLSALNTAIKTGERRASLINGKIHNFKLERDVMVQQAASHIQDSFDGHKLASALRHSLVLR